MTNFLKLFNYKLKIPIRSICHYWIGFAFVCMSSDVCAQLKSFYQVDPGTGKHISYQHDAIYNDGYFYLSGNAHDSLNYQPTVLKVDTLGHLIWTTTYCNPFTPTGGVSLSAGLHFLYLLGGELYGVGYDYIWKIDQQDGKILWFTNLGSNHLAGITMSNFAENSVLLFDGNNFLVINKISGQIEKNIQTIEGNGFCVDSTLNIYLAQDEFYSKYDSAFNLLWKKEIPNPNSANARVMYYHKSTEHVIMAGDSWKHIIAIHPVTGDTIWDRKLTIPVGESVSDFRFEGPFAYLLWRNAQTSSGGFVLVKINLETSEVIYHFIHQIENKASGSESFDIQGDNIYITGVTGSDAIKRNLGIVKLNKITGEIIYSKPVFAQGELSGFKANFLKAVGNSLFIGTRWGSKGLPGGEYNEGENYRSCLLKLDATTGDSLANFLFPGRRQFETRTTHLKAVGEGKFIAATQLSDTLVIAAFDYNLKRFWETKLAHRWIQDIVTTQDRIGLLTRDAYAQVYGYVVEGHARFLNLLDMSGNPVFQKSLEEDSDYEITNQQNTFQISKPANLNETFNLWQINQNSLANIFSIKSPGGSMIEKFIPVDTQTSLLLEAYSQLQIKKMYINTFNAATKLITRIQTLDNYLGVKSASLIGDDLYLSASLANHPTSTSIFLRYNIKTRQKIWEIIGRSFAETYALKDFLFGLNSNPNGTYLYGIDGQGAIVWDTLIPFTYTKLKFKLDTLTEQLLIFDNALITSTEERIFLGTVSKTGIVSERIHYIGFKPNENHLFDALPLEYNSRPYLLTCGAYHHPVLRKTAFIQIYDQSIFKKPGKVSVFFDQNKNKIRDLGEQEVFLGRVRLNSLQYITISDPSPNEVFHYSDLDTLTYLPHNDWYLTTDSIQLLQAEDTTLIEYGVSTDLNENAVLISISPYGPWRCLTTTRLKTQVLNIGYAPVNGIAKIVLPGSFEYQGGNAPVSWINGDTLFYTFDDLKPGKFFSVIITVRIPASELLGSIQQVSFYADHYTFSPEESFSEKTTFQNVIRCSYDPNDKCVNPIRGDNNLTLITEPLSYTIRFQNTGNDTAFMVEIIDTLSADLDWSSFNFLSSSHTCEVTFHEGILRVLFMHISLPDSNVDYTNSQGFFHFSIYSKKEIENNTPVHNRASIYFDFNIPVLTNTTTSTLVDELILNVKPVEPAPIFHIFPNPASHTLSFSAKEQSAYQVYRLTIIDLFGRKHISSSFVFGDWISIEQLSPGIYFMEIPGFQTQKLIVD